MKHLLLLIFITLFSTLSLASDLNILVPLSPAGSFQIEADKIRGKVKKVGGDAYTASKIFVKVDDLKTGMDLRDEHMKAENRLNEKKYPRIEVTNIKAKGGKGIGVIHIKGKKEKINFVYKANSKDFTAKFKLDVTKFPLKDLKYLGVGVKGVVAVTAVIPIKN